VVITDPQNSLLSSTETDKFDSILNNFIIIIIIIIIIITIIIEFLTSQL